VTPGETGEMMRNRYDRMLLLLFIWSCIVIGLITLYLTDNLW